jgi:hypothetical protein
LIEGGLQHLEIQNDQWKEETSVLSKAGLPEDLVLYCARPDFGTSVLQKTGNIAADMNSMGHSDVKMAMTYQHPELNVVRDAINSRHILQHTAETVD